MREPCGPISIGRSSADVRRSGKKLAEGIAQREARAQQR
jgi:hypothetical protein